MKQFFKTTTSKSKKTITTIFMVAALALSPLTVQLSYSNTGAKNNINKSYPIAKNIIKIMDQLKLSPKQNEQIQKALFSHQKDYINLTSKINSTKNQLLNLSTNTSGTQLKTLAQTQSKNINKLIQLRVKVRQEIFSILNPEQTKQLNEKWKSFQKEQLDKTAKTAKTATNPKNNPEKTNQ